MGKLPQAAPTEWPNIKKKKKGMDSVIITKKTGKYYFIIITV